MVTNYEVSAANHLPMEINASTMVVRSQRSAIRHSVDVILTIGVWLLFLYLFGKGVWAVGTNQTAGLDVPYLSRALPSIDTLAIYALAMGLQAFLLILWALYNWSRFHGKSRRNITETLDDEQLTRSYGIDQSMLRNLRSRPISIIHHAPDGAITAITHEYATPIVDSISSNIRHA